MKMEMRLEPMESQTYMLWLCPAYQDIKKGLLETNQT